MAAPKRVGIRQAAMAAWPLYAPEVEKWIRDYPEDIQVSRPFITVMFTVAHNPTWLRKSSTICTPKMFAESFAAEPDFVASFLAFVRELIRTKRRGKRHCVQEWLLLNQWTLKAPDSYGKLKPIGELSASEVADRVNADFRLAHDQRVSAADIAPAECALRKRLAKASASSSPV